MATTRRWRDLTPGQQNRAIITAVVEAALTSAALIDLAKRPAGQVRGSKRLWALGCLVQPLGPIAYLAFGRRTT